MAPIKKKETSSQGQQYCGIIVVAGSVVNVATHLGYPELLMVEWLEVSLI